MPITLQFVEDDHFYDPIVQYVSHGWATHVDVIVDHETFGKFFPAALQLLYATPMLNDGYMLLGARPRGGVMLRPKDYSDFKRVAQITLPSSRITPAAEATFYSFLSDQIGKHYNFIGVLGFVTGDASLGEGRQWGDGKSWFCSELTDSGIEKLNFFPVAPVKPAAAVSPADQFYLLSAFAPVQWVK